MEKLPENHDIQQWRQAYRVLQGRGSPHCPGDDRLIALVLYETQDAERAQLADHLVHAAGVPTSTAHSCVSTTTLWRHFRVLSSQGPSRLTALVRRRAAVNAAAGHAHHTSWLPSRRSRARQRETGPVRLVSFI
jgi:hypothetical protein